MSNTLTTRRVKALLRAAAKSRVLVVGDVMLDQFLWGHVKRISPEAPVPVVEFERESFMPGGAANVARNLTALGTGVDLFGLVGKDDGAKRLRALLKEESVGSGGLKPVADRMTTRKTRVVAHQQQVVRIDRETKQAGDSRTTKRLLTAIEKAIEGTDAIIIGDYNKGVVTQDLLAGLRALCSAGYPPGPRARVASMRRAAPAATLGGTTCSSWVQRGGDPSPSSRASGCASMSASLCAEKKDPLALPNVPLWELVALEKLGCC